MALAQFALSEITEATLLELIKNEILESRTLEYKERIPDQREARREFLADVSSFANAAGGDLVIGIRERNGRPVDLVGLGDSAQADGERLRVEHLLRDGVDPSLTQVQIHVVPVSAGRFCLVVRVPRSWHPPHMVTVGGHGRFYARNAGGKYPLDVAELRQVFARSEGIAERIRRFRAERLARIVAGETPCALKGSGRIVLHVIPLASADPLAGAIDVRNVGDTDPPALGLLRQSGLDWRYNVDGFLNFYNEWGYSQLFRNGAIEGVDAVWLHRAVQHGSQALPSVSFEENILKAIRRYMEVQEKKLHLLPPTVVLLSLLGVRDVSLAVGPGRVGTAFGVDSLLVPEIVIDAPAFSFSDAAVKPVYDVLWNASGYHGSPNFDKHGDWNPRI